MKRIISVMLFIVLTAPSGYSQKPLSDLFNGRSKLTFLGVDFTQAKFIGSYGFTDPAAIQTQFMPEWNALIIREPAKFSLQEAFKLTADSYSSDVDMMINRNKNLKVLEMITDGTHNIDDNVVAKAVSGYDLKGKEGIGIVYIVESFSKTYDMAYIWVTFFDMSSKKVLLTEKVEGKAQGFGFRNFWAGAIYAVNKKIKTTYYKNWSAAHK